MHRPRDLLAEPPTIATIVRSPGGPLDPCEPKAIRGGTPGLASAAIATSSKFLYELLIRTAAKAARRLTAAQIAVGPWRQHKFIAPTACLLDALIVAEVLAEEVAKQTPASANGAPGTGRPHNPFSSGYECPAVQVPLPLGSVSSTLVVAFPSEPAAHTTAERGRINLAPSWIRNFSVQDESRDSRWTGDVVGTLAHELAHVWQFEHWRDRDVPHSPGGGSDEYSPHGIRPWEVHANACGDAAWLAVCGYSLDVLSTRRSEIIGRMSRPDTHWRNYWCVWCDPAYGAANPAAAYAAKTYHRILRSVFPVFQSVLAARPPLLNPT